MDTGPNASVLERYLVERYWPGVKEGELRVALSRVGRVVSQMARRGVAVRYLSSALIPGEESVLCVFEAGSVKDIAEANQLAGVRFDRISPVIDVTDRGEAPLEDEPKEVRR